jgi:hypothetical protein
VLVIALSSDWGSPSVIISTIFGASLRPAASSFSASARAFDIYVPPPSTIARLESIGSMALFDADI